MHSDGMCDTFNDKTGTKFPYICILGMYWRDSELMFSDVPSGIIMETGVAASSKLCDDETAGEFKLMGIHVCQNKPQEKPVTYHYYCSELSSRWKICPGRLYLNTSQQSSRGYCSYPTLQRPGLDYEWKCFNPNFWWHFNGGTCSSIKGRQKEIWSENSFFRHFLSLSLRYSSC